MRHEVGIDRFFFQLDQFGDGSIAAPDVEDAVDVATKVCVAISISSGLGLRLEGVGRVRGLEPRGERRKENSQQDGDGFVDQQLSRLEMESHSWRKTIRCCFFIDPQEVMGEEGRKCAKTIF